MRKRTVTTGLVAGLAGLALVGTTLPAQAVETTTGNTTVESNDTPDNNPMLPLVHIKRPNTQLKANILNPRPVCNAFEDHRTVIYTVKDNFTPIGAIETKNTSNVSIPLTQTLSKTQTISLKLTGDYGHSFGSLSGSLSRVVDGITGTVNGTAPSDTAGAHAEISYSLSWTAGQQVGPYQVPPGYTGKAVYGFRTVSFEGTQQRCKANGTWSDTWAYIGTAPLSNAVELKLYNNNAQA